MLLRKYCKRRENHGEVFRTGEYPAYEDLRKALGIEPLKHKPMTLSAQ
ncbi:MAG: hypothetical protein GW873_04690 [Nitrospirae bacterium]|nr:hypothetical protein [Nitrospirota bacterium]